MTNTTIYVVVGQPPKGDFGIIGPFGERTLRLWFLIVGPDPRAGLTYRLYRDEGIGFKSPLPPLKKEGMLDLFLKIVHLLV